MKHKPLIPLALRKKGILVNSSKAKNATSSMDLCLGYFSKIAMYPSILYNLLGRDPAGKGLSYWPARLNRLAGLYYNSIPAQSPAFTDCSRIPAM
jgi:hypothetical protein